jgi:hypothetical protein
LHHIGTFFSENLKHLQSCTDRAALEIKTSQRDPCPFESNTHATVNAKRQNPAIKVSALAGPRQRK